MSGSGSRQTSVPVGPRGNARISPGRRMQRRACREPCLNFLDLGGWSAADVSVWLFKGLVARVFLWHEGAEMRQERKANGDGPYLLSAASQVCLPPAPAQETSDEARVSLARRRRHPARRTRAPRANAPCCA